MVIEAIPNEGAISRTNDDIVRNIINVVFEGGTLNMKANAASLLNLMIKCFYLNKEKMKVT